MRRFGSVALLVCLRSGTCGGSDDHRLLAIPPQAPTGFATPTLENSPGSQSTSNGMMLPPGETFANAQAIFEEEDGVDGSLGPVYNAHGCVDCHQNPLTGGAGQVTELRVGHRDSFGNFVNPTITINNGANSIPNRSLVNDRAICPGIVTDKNGIQHNFLQTNIQERVPGSENIRTFRTSLNTLGDGFVEAINSNTLVAIANNEFNQTGGRINPLVIQVPVLEAPGNNRVGRFGWKNQMASLLSFASDAYLNEQGITNRLGPSDFTTVCKVTTDPEDTANDIDTFA